MFSIFRQLILPQSLQQYHETFFPSNNKNATKIRQNQGDCRKEPQRDPLCTKTKINQNKEVAINNLDTQMIYKAVLFGLQDELFTHF